jgi:hypothetical protein
MTETIDRTLQDELFEIEDGFWLKGRDHFLEHLDRQCLLAFPQMGEMHGVFPREEVAATATTPGRWRDLKVGNRQLLQPTPDLAIISYRADVVRGDGEPYAALVSSGYVRREGGWKLASHQHSPV